MPEESPLFPLKPRELFSMAKPLINSGIPISLSYVAGFATSLISLAFAGRNQNPLELSGFALGYTMINLFCLGLFLSFDQGFAILASKLFGAQKYQEMGTMYQRHLFITAIICIPMILAMLFSDSILVGFGFNQDIGRSTATFLRSMIPSLIGTCLFNSTKHFLASQNIFKTPAIIIVSFIPIHALLCHVFIDIHGMGTAGVGLAKSIADVTAALLLFSYIRFTGICKDTWTPWTKECLEDIGSHLQRTFVLGGTSFLELLTFELSLLIMGALNDISIFAAYAIAISLASAIIFISAGISMSMQTMIGNAIGEGDKEKVQKVLAGGITLNLISCFVIALATVIFREQIASFYTNEQSVSETLQIMLLFVTFAHIPESLARIIGGVLRAVGKEKQVLIAFLVCFWGIGIGGQWTFGVKHNYGYIPFCLFTVMGACSMLAYVAYEVWTMNWKQQIGSVKRALDQQIYAETQGLIEFSDMTEGEVYKSFAN